MRPVSSAKCIDFSNHTTVQQIVGDDQSIPLHKFDLLNLADVYEMARGYAIDQVPIYTIGKILLYIVTTGFHTPNILLTFSHIMFCRCYRSC